MPTEEEELIAKGAVYHELVGRFLKEHPEAVESLASEQDYLAFTMIKVSSLNLMFGAMLDLPGMMDSFKEALCACFIQGYYRAYQELQLAKMEDNHVG